MGIPFGIALNEVLEVALRLIAAALKARPKGLALKDSLKGTPSDKLRVLRVAIPGAYIPKELSGKRENFDRNWGYLLESRNQIPVKLIL
jgi:hypothetical protein